MKTSPRIPLVAGVDEAGRGPLAGPVAVAAVILDPQRPIDGLADSKRLSPRRRDALFETIRRQALAIQVVLVPASTIDRVNILRATLEGMEQVMTALSPQPDTILVDGNQLPRVTLPASVSLQALVGGDALEPAISAASIIAKVTRDRWMAQLHRQYPDYGFDRHKGYPTAAHLEALGRHGACPEHRRSFAPVRRVVGRET